MVSPLWPLLHPWAFPRRFCLGTSPHLTSYMPRIACLLTQGAGECCFGGSCPPSQLPEERPHRGKGSSLGAFEAQGGEGLPCAPDLGGPGSAPHLPPWEESRETMGRGALARRTPASWQSGEGCGGGGRTPSPQPAESPPGELVVAGVSPQGAQMARVS